EEEVGVGNGLVVCDPEPQERPQSWLERDPHHPSLPLMRIIVSSTNTAPTTSYRHRTRRRRVPTVGPTGVSTHETSPGRPQESLMLSPNCFSTDGHTL